MRRPPIALVLLAVLTVVAGCGDDDDRVPATSTTSTTAIDPDAEATKAQLIALGDESCASLHETLDAARPESDDEWADALADIIQRGSKTHTDLASLFVPEAEDPDHVQEQLVRALGSWLDTLAEARAAANAGDLDSMRTLVDKAEPLLHTADDAAQDYGFKVCGSYAGA